MKNNLYMHRVSVCIITYSFIETLASIELTFSFDRMNSQSKQPSIKLYTRYVLKLANALDVPVNPQDIEISHKLKRTSTESMRGLGVR